MRAFVAGGQNGKADLIDARVYVDLFAVYNVVYAAVYDYAAYAGQIFERFGLDVMRKDFAVHAELADFARDGCVFGAAKIQDRDHASVHTMPPCF